MQTRSVALLSLLVVFTLVTFSQTPYTWTQKVSGSGHGNSLCVNPVNPDIIYGSPNTSMMWISRDRGDTWVQLGSVGGSGGIAAIAVNPLDTNQIVVAQRGSPNRVMKTTNHGQTWTQTWAGGSFNSYGVPLEHKPYFPNLVYVMGSSQFYRSNDFGSTWTMVATAGFNAWCDAEISPLDDMTVLLGTTVGGIWKTTNGGVSWTLKFSNGCSEIPMVAWSPSNPNVVYATRWGGCSSGMAKSTDGGETWTLISNVPSSMWSLAVSPTDPNYVVACNYGINMYISRNGAQSWTLTNTGLSGSGNGALVVDTFKVFALNGGIFKLNVPQNLSTRNVRMVLSVDVNHGLDYHNDFPLVSPTSVWVKGQLPVLGSLQGNWTYSDTSTGRLIRLYDDGTNGDITPGDNIWTRSIIVPTGTNRGEFIYKYGAAYPGVDTVNGGIEYLNNESAAADFHSANFTDADTVLVLAQDRWKTRGTVNSTNVAVSVDLRGGADYYTGAQISSVTQSVWVKGSLNILGRMNGNWTFSDTTGIMVRLYDDGTNGDPTAGDRIWTRVMVFPENTRYGTFAYKYAAVYPGVENNNGGVAYLNNEAASTVFHQAVLAESSLALTLTDQWLTRAQPVFQVSPQSFAITVEQGQVGMQVLTLSNAAEIGSGVLTYSLRATDPSFDSTSVFGSFTETFTGASRDRGNIYYVNRNTILKEIRTYLGISSSTDLRFFVYEGDTRTGTYTRIFQTGITTATGTDWYESGPIAVNLQAGKYYYIGSSWLGSVTYGRDATFQGPIPTDFGTLLTAQTFTVAGYPPAATISGSQFGGSVGPYYQSVTVNASPHYITLSSTEGQIEPEESQEVTVTFETANLSVGDYFPEFTILTNDPNNLSYIVQGHLTVSPVLSAGDEDVPTEFALLQNYPNPFNPVTRIEFHVPTRRHVALRIFDVLGREVATLVDGVRDAGKHTVVWDAQVSKTAASGIYFYRLIAGEFVQVHKMLLLK
jgi:photosystem II stability/assembly factor-like uncharacterized protein